MLLSETCVYLTLITGITMAAVDDCQELQFWNGTHCVQCSGCPRGFGVRTECSHKTDTECEACWPGYDYSNTTGNESCILCDTYSDCLPGNSKKIKNCTIFSGPVCDGCEEGNWLNLLVGNIGGCVECSPPCNILEEETRSCTTDHDRRCAAKAPVTSPGTSTDSSTSSVKGIPTSTKVIPTTKGIPTAQGETKEPTEPVMVPDKSRRASSIPSVENKGLWGVVSGTVVLLVVAVPIAVAVAIYKRKRRATAAGERLNNQQRRPLMASANLGLDQPISNLSIEERRYITQRLNGAYSDGYFYWQTSAEECGLRAQCEGWRHVENPAEKFLRAYGEQAGSTIRKLVEVLRHVRLTQFANEIEDKFSPPQDQGENENAAETAV